MRSRGELRRRDSSRLVLQHEVRFPVIKLPPDVTFLVQLVAFIVFWQLMRVLLFEPVQRALEARKLRTIGARREAEGLEAEASAIASQIALRLEEARTEGAREAEGIRRRGEAEEREIVERYRNEAVSLLDAARASTARQIEAARSPLRAEAERLAEGVVAKILGSRIA